MNIYLIAFVWLTLALVAAVVSVRFGTSVALVEILVGAVAGNIPAIADHVAPTDVTALRSVALTFFAGAEIDPVLQFPGLNEPA